MSIDTGAGMTSSPQESGGPGFEAEEYKYQKVQWKDFFTKPKYIPWWIISIVVSVLLILLTVHHDQVVEALRPISQKIRDLPGGFVIPVVILIVISFPPLFGHELIALLCGVVYGLWIGFAIVAVGTFVGEIGTWFAFRYAFRRKAFKLEKTNLNYGALARFTRDGGFLVVLIIRFSIIPSHFSTAVFSTCNVKFWHFAIATFLTLPKQIILVYIGVLLVQESKNDKVNTIVLGITFLVTIIAALYVYFKMRQTKKILLEEQTARLEAKQNSPGDFNPNVNMRPGENFSQMSSYGRGAGSVRPPMRARWQEAAFEMEDTKRPAKMQEFI